MNDGENPDGAAVNFIHESVAAVRREFAGFGHFAFVAEHWVISKPGDGLAEQVIDPDGSAAIVCK